jgi:hypothetical protein
MRNRRFVARTILGLTPWMIAIVSSLCVVGATTRADAQLGPSQADKESRRDKDVAPDPSIRSGEAKLDPQAAKTVELVVRLAEQMEALANRVDALEKELAAAQKKLAALEATRSTAVGGSSQ